MTGGGDVAAFLRSPAGLGRFGPVAEIETHAARVFLAGDRAFKLKKPVALGYLDFSTPERRRAALEAELDLNRRFSPELYERVLPVTCAGDGTLALDGTGVHCDWLLVMRRFAQRHLLDRVVAERGLDAPLAEALADTVRDSYTAAPVQRKGRAGDIARVAAINAAALRTSGFEGEAVERLIAATENSLAAAMPLCETRRRLGFVRRCHGDLHLRNIVLLDGRPRLFDGLEFDADLGTIDVLYDLAFLLMDLLHRGERAAANMVLNRYLLMAEEDARPAEIAGLALLPLFLSLRAAVRAHVGATMGEGAEARVYLEAALAFLAPAPPRLLAVGGLSGAGKSRLALSLAPDLGAPPGAVLLRADERRKRLFGRNPRARLPPEAYTPKMSAKVYALLRQEAALLLAAGRAVVLDAVHAHRAERAAAAAVAQAARVPFAGLWLTAAPDTLRARIAARQGDASDADAAVLSRQLAFAEPLGPDDWTPLDAAGPPAQTLAAARAIAGVPAAT